MIEGVGRRSFSSGAWGEPGTPTEVGEKSLNGYERNMLFWNRGGTRYSEVAYATSANRIEDGRSLAIADLDHDGRLDIVLNNFNRPAVLLCGKGPERSWLQVELIGTTSARDAAGARVVAESASGRQMRQVSIGSGYLGCSSRVLHFGLGTDQTVRLEVHWPSGLVEEYRDVTPRRRLRLVEGEGTPRTGA